MPRKKSAPPEAASVETSSASTAISEPPAESKHATDGTGKNYGPPYKSVFTSAEKGFELGENRQFRQRVFTFKERPAQEVIDRLKEHGFTYRPAEKAWTVEATAESRVLTDRLAREFAGKSASMDR